MVENVEKIFVFVNLLILMMMDAFLADKFEIVGPNDLLNLVNVMDAFLAPVHIVSHQNMYPPTLNVPQPFIGPVKSNSM